MLERFEPSPEIQKIRDEAAERIRAKRRERDFKNREAGRFGNKLKSLLGIYGGSTKIEREAKTAQEDAEYELKSSQTRIEMAEQAERTEQIRRVTNTVESLERVRRVERATPDKFMRDALVSMIDFIEESSPYLVQGLSTESEAITVLGDIDKLLSITTEEARESGDPNYDLYERISNFSLGFIGDNLDKIEKHMPSKNDRLRGACFGACADLINFSSETSPRVELGLRVVGNNEKFLREGFSSPYPFGMLYNPYNKCLRAMLERGDEENRAVATSVIEEQLVTVQEKSNLFSRMVLMGGLLDSKNKETIRIGKGLFAKILGRYGLDCEEVIEAWLAGGIGGSVGFGQKIGDRLGYTAARNIEDMESLDKERPGIVKFLNEEFGICHFTRYPSELLVNQFDQFENNELPYGIVLYPISDHNGAFHGESRLFKDLLGRLDNRYLLRVFECKSKIDIARFLIKLDRKYGPKHRISFAIIGGHGSQTSINFGEWSGIKSSPNLNNLFIEDLKGRGVARSGSFFEPNPTIMLFSCSTGAREGIGQKVSEVLGGKVIAPDRPTSPTAIHVEFKDGQPVFKIDYGDKEVTKVYMSGKPDIGES